MRAKRPAVGDVVEVRTAKGLCYAQASHFHPRYGALLRAFPTFSAARPDDLAAVVAEREAFVLFFPLGAAVRAGRVEPVGRCDVPASARGFPTFRAGTPDPVTRKVETWWLWDGEREWRVGALTPEQRAFPIRGVWNDTMLVARLEAGWTPATDPT